MWYYAQSGQQYGPIAEDDLKQLLAERRVLPGDLVWRQGMADWQPASSVVELASAFEHSPGFPPPLPDPAVESRRIAAGVFALMLGSLGVHKFYLGMTLPGVILLLSTLLTCGIGAMVTHVIGIIEGIIYLSKTDADFYRDYLVEKRPWF